LSALTGVLANAEGQPAMWSRVAAWGGLLFAAGAVAGLGGEGIVSFLAKDAGQDVARAGMAFAFFLLSACLVILQKGLFWSWLGRYGLVVAAVNLIGAAAIFDTPDGPLGVLRTRVAPPALALWIVAAA